LRAWESFRSDAEGEMHRLVTIDLSAADIQEFEAYEATVLPLLAKYGARLEMRLRSVDGLSETHVLFFPDMQAFENFREDPIRVAAQPSWKACGAKSVTVEVERLG
jgi:uncharacterized protein (DUF1330 family)